MTSEAREGRLGDAFIAWSLGKLVYLNRGKGKSVPRPTCGILLFGYPPLLLLSIGFREATGPGMPCNILEFAGCSLVNIYKPLMHLLYLALFSTQ